MRFFVKTSPEKLTRAADDGSGCLGGNMSRNDKKMVDNGKMDSSIVLSWSFDFCQKTEASIGECKGCCQALITFNIPTVISKTILLKAMFSFNTQSASGVGYVVYGGRIAKKEKNKT